MKRSTDTIVHELQQRIDELETKVSFLELANQEMSDVMYAQQQAIEKRLDRLSAALEKLEQPDAPSTSLLDDIPPHY
ncbi:MAG: SlyX family protein [Pseudomonadota bacterium]